MIVKNPNNYRLLGFEQSNTQNKKYDAILQNKTTKAIKKVPFGDVRYQQYRDSTPLKLYKHLNHNDKERRRLYRARHEKDMSNKFSSGYFSSKFLW